MKTATTPGTYNPRMAVRYFLLLIGLSPALAQAGVYYSAEQPAELPSSWRGYLLDQRSLRQIGVAPANLPPTLLREQYLDAAKKLDEAAKQRPLKVDEAADLGAIHIRLNQPTRAIEVLRAAQREHPDHFRLNANLGTAWQMQGDLEAAARSLREAVKMAPVKHKIFEEYHLKLVQSRLREAKQDGLDRLFDDFTKLPEADVAILQQLGLWLPSDGRLLWQLGELANAHGDVRTAANILDGCVTEFALGYPQLRANRKKYREEADRIAALPDSEHEKYRGDIKFRSTRPLAKQIDPAMLPAIRPDGVNMLPWLVMGETTVGRGFKPSFAKYLQDLDGKRVAMTGFMYPVGMEMGDTNTFMLVEYPIGCWFCETPEPAGMMYVSLKEGTTPIKKGLVKVEGTLKLNRADPEQYLQALRDATIGEPD